MIGLDVDCAGVLVFELPLAHGASHRHVRRPVGVVGLQVHRFELLQLGVRLGPVPLERPAVVKHQVTARHSTGEFNLLNRIYITCFNIILMALS